MTNILTKAKRLSNTAILFLLLAPAIVILYGSYVFNPSHMFNPILYLFLIIADAISIMAVMGLWFTILFDVLIPEHHIQISLSQKKVFLKSKPSVDILITTAGEPVDIIEKTLVAALSVEYEHNTFVLDDARSEDVKNLAQKHNAFYITREDNQHAKAGNINNALQKVSKADFFVILDADQIARENLINTMLPYMSDPMVAMVQSPQSFTNLDEFIPSGTNQAQEVFYKYVCPAKNVSNSTFCVGTNVMFRRNVIDKIGGIAKVSHSEDIWTSYKIHELGLKTVFVNQILATGLAPDTIQAYFKQQHRWAKGGFSMLFDNNPLFSQHLTVDQKIQYFLSNTFYLVCLPILAYILFPIIYLLFGTSPLDVSDTGSWLIHYLPFVALYYGLSWMLLGKLNISTISISVASFYPYLTAFFSSFIKGKDVWIATSSRRGRKEPLMKWLWPHYLIIIMTVLSLAIGWYNADDYLATVFYSALAMWNMYLLYLFITSEKRAAF